MTALNCAVVGCGYFAGNHLHAWKMIPDIHVAALCDTDASKAQYYSREFQIPAVYTNLDDLIQHENVDFIDIVTQPHTHRELVEKAAIAHLNMICQKPLAPSFEDAQAMVEGCQNAGVTMMVHENFRWQTPMRKVKVLTKDLGSLFYGRIHFRSGYDVYANQPYLAEDPRFIIYDLGVHLVDLARFFMGEVVSLYCHTQNINPKVRAEDTATILLKMKNGATCIVEVSYASHPEEELFPQTQLFLEGAYGSVTLGPHYQITLLVNGKSTKIDASPAPFDWCSPPGIPIQESVYHIQKHWVDCLHQSIEPETSGQDNLKTIELVFGAYQSAETNQPYQVRGA